MGRFLISSAPSDGPSSPELHRRMRWLVAVVIIGFLGLTVRLYQLQIVRGEQYFARALSNVIHERYIPSVRGEIVDRNGTPLASNRPSFSIYAYPRLYTEEVHSRDPRRAVLLLADQERDRAALVAQSHLELPGLEVRDDMNRFYPNDRTAAHVVGYMNQMRSEELDELADQGYDASELIGRYGIERAWENYLRGKKGIERFVADARGRRMDDEESNALIDKALFEAPVAGHRVVLTLDLELQRLVEKAVRRHAAAAVAVTEVSTGRILALVSTPAYDPNIMTGRLTREEEALLVSDPRKPFIDKTVRQHYPPGSVYKFITAVAALEDGLVDEEELITTPSWYRIGGRVFHGDSCDARTNMLQAFANSCNTYFWKLAELVGIDRMALVARDFGFGAPSGVGINGEVGGRVPTKLWYEERGPFKVGYTLNAATGQGDVEVTVLQLAMAYTAIANGGKLFVPQLVERVETAGGEVVTSFEPMVRRQVRASASTLDAVKRGMWRVVNSPAGTIYEHGHSDIVEYAGKTGTAQVRNKRREPEKVKGWHPHRHHAWFTGYAPATNPEIALVVLVEHGGSGGKVAGPVARRIVEGYFTKIKKGATQADGAEVNR
jgi:penicillin-binding protein 2